MQAPDVEPFRLNADAVGVAVARPEFGLRWFDPAPARRSALSLGAILAASVALHGLLAFGVDWVDRLVSDPKQTAEQEIPVEVVDEVPGEQKNGQPPQSAGPGTEAAEQATARQAAAPAETKPEPPRAPEPPTPTPAAPPEPPRPQQPAQQAVAPPAPQPAPPPLVQPSPAPVEPPPLRQALGDPPRAREVAAPSRPDGPTRAEEGPPPPSAPPVSVAGILFLPETFKMAATPGVTASKEELDSYKSVVFQRVISNRQFPESARQRGASGVAVVSFVLDAAGNLAGASLLRSTGHRDLDAEAIAMVKRSAPFPKPPPGAVLNFTPLIEFGRDD